MRRVHHAEIANALNKYEERARVFAADFYSPSLLPAAHKRTVLRAIEKAITRRGQRTLKNGERAAVRRRRREESAAVMLCG